jgi:hypothetical protein
VLDSMTKQRLRKDKLLSLCLTEHNTKKMNWGEEEDPILFIESAIVIENCGLWQAKISRIIKRVIFFCTSLLFYSLCRELPCVSVISEL